MGFGFQFLSVRDDYWRYLEAIAVFGNRVRGIGKNASRAAGGVLQGADQAWIGLDKGVIRVKQ